MSHELLQHAALLWHGTLDAKQLGGLHTPLWPFMLHTSPEQQSPFWLQLLPACAHTLVAHLPLLPHAPLQHSAGEAHVAPLA